MLNNGIKRPIPKVSRNVPNKINEKNKNNFPVLF
jgi:hypothetical protein